MTTTIEMVEWLDKCANTAQFANSVVIAETYRHSAQRLRELDKTDCNWTYDDEQFMYDTGCDNAWSFAEGLTLAENAIKYCPFCGGDVKEST